MSGYMSSLIEKVKMNFLTDPNSLLMEIKETMILDCSEITDVVQDYADELFLSPVLGVYKPNEHIPLFSAHETLFTHESTFEFFPEISSQLFTSLRIVDKTERRVGGTAVAHMGQVGTKIDWRTAVEQKINVYNAEGNLLLKSTDRRDNFVFSPGANVYARQFVLDMTKYFIYEALPWAETDQIVFEAKQYTLDTLDIEATFENMLSKLCNTNYFKAIKSFIEKELFLVYHINNIGNNVLIESSCDYRHYKCNQVLWDKEHASDKNADVFEAYHTPEQPHGKIKFEELGGLFINISKATGKSVTSLTEFYDLLNQLEQNVSFSTVALNLNMKKTISKVIDMYLQETNDISKNSRKFINKITQHKNETNRSFDFDQAVGIYFL